MCHAAMLQEPASRLDAGLVTEPVNGQSRWAQLDGLPGVGRYMTLPTPHSVRVRAMLGPLGVSSSQDTSRPSRAAAHAASTAVW